MEDLTAGAVTRTKLKLLYISTIAKPDIVADVRDRLSRLDYDGILDKRLHRGTDQDRQIHTIFPRSSTRKSPTPSPARCSRGGWPSSWTGRPYALSAPAVFSDFIQASEDYYYSFYVASSMRLLRYIALFLTLFVPAVFVALTTFHQEIIPTPLLVSIAAQREGVPFPLFSK